MTDPSSVADAFVQAYYVDTQPEQALSLCGGLACETLQEELALRQGEVIAADTRRPRITMKRERSVAGEGEHRFFYRISVSPPEATTFFRLVYIKTREREGHWKVTQFSDQEGGGTF